MRFQSHLLMMMSLRNLFLMMMMMTHFLMMTKIQNPNCQSLSHCLMMMMMTKNWTVTYIIKYTFKLKHYIWDLYGCKN